MREKEKKRKSKRMGYSSSSRIGLCLFLFFTFALLSSARISLSFSGTFSPSFYFSVYSVSTIYSFVWICSWLSDFHELNLLPHQNLYPLSHKNFFFFSLVLLKKVSITYTSSYHIFPHIRKSENVWYYIYWPVMWWCSHDPYVKQCLS